MHLLIFGSSKNPGQKGHSEYHWRRRELFCGAGSSGLRIDMRFVPIHFE